MAHRSLHPLLHYLRRLSDCVPNEEEDGPLLSRFLAHHEEGAFAAILRRYGALVWSVCVRRLGESAEAEDAFQACFLALVQKPPGLHTPRGLGPWLYSVACRTAARALGQRQRQARREKPLPELLAGPCSTEPAEQAWQQLQPVIDEEVNRLPEKYRQPVLLCYLQGLTSAEAALRLGCRQGTIFSRLSRARAILRPRLLRRGIEVSAGMLAALLAGNASAQALPAQELLESTTRFARALAVGTGGPALSTSLATLLQGAVNSMSVGKTKLVVAALVILVLSGAAIGFLAHRTGAEPPPADALAQGSSATPSTKEAREPASPAPASDVSQAQVDGLVVDEAGKPVAGVKVASLGDQSAEARSGLDGTFRLILHSPSARYETIVASTDDGARQGIFAFNDTVLVNPARARLVLKPSRERGRRGRQDHPGQGGDGKGPAHRQERQAPRGSARPVRPVPGSQRAATGPCLRAYRRC
jgi:RNA polymerase sigma factor (sigma-70 family)